MLFHATGLVTLFDGNAFCYLVLWFCYLSSHAVLLNFNGKGLFSPMECSIGGRVSLHIEYFLVFFCEIVKRFLSLFGLVIPFFHSVAYTQEMYMLGEY